MKAMLVVGSDTAYKLAGFYIRPLGFELIRYRQAIKAMDNIDEVDPDAVIVSAADFPRHWKTLVQFIRSERLKEKTVVIILKGACFPYEEAAKAAFIGVNGIVSENLDNPDELDRLQGILGRYTPLENARQSRRVRPADWDRLEFLFSLPDSLTVITGRVESISGNGISFRPDFPALVDALKPGAVLSECSLRAGDAILSPSAEVVRVDRSLSLALTFVPEESAALDAYLRDRPLRERAQLNRAQATTN
jgi:hypothetical protein